MPHRLIWSTVPVMAFEDAEATCDFYARLGFSLVYMSQDYLAMQCDGIEMHFARSGTRSVGGPSTCYIRTPDVDRLQAEFVGKLLHDLPEAQEMPWRMRELHLHDPFGNLLRFGQPSTD